MRRRYIVFWFLSDIFAWNYDIHAKFAVKHEIMQSVKNISVKTNVQARQAHKICETLYTQKNAPNLKRYSSKF